MKAVAVQLVILGSLLSAGAATAQYCWNCDYEGTRCIEAYTGVGGCCCACVVYGGSCGIAACFLAETMIDVPGGKQSIENLKPGDRVASTVDGKPVEVVSVYHAIADEYFVINNDLRVTRYHPFNVNGAWKEAGELRVGDICVNISGVQTKISSIERVENGVRVYNISVGWPHTFYAGSWPVHNKPEIPGG